MNATRLSRVDSEKFLPGFLFLSDMNPCTSEVAMPLSWRDSEGDHIETEQDAQGGPVVRGGSERDLT